MADFIIRRTAAPSFTPGRGQPIISDDPFQPHGTLSRVAHEYWRALPDHRHGGIWVSDVEQATAGTHEQAQRALERVSMLGLRDGGGLPRVIEIGLARAEAS